MKEAAPRTPNFPIILDDEFECPHVAGYSRICGQCVAKLRAEGFQDGYAKGMDGTQPKIVDHSPKPKTFRGTFP